MKTSPSMCVFNLSAVSPVKLLLQKVRNAWENFQAGIKYLWFLVLMLEGPIGAFQINNKDFHMRIQSNQSDWCPL